MKKVNVAILGLGVVGAGVYEVIEKTRDMIKKTRDADISVVKVLEKSPEHAKQKGVPAEKIAGSIDEIVSDKSISIVVETIGGVEPAKSFILRCFKAGKHVVTANKELIAKHWAELEAEAVKNNVGLYFEASCVGGVPVIRALYESMQANNILELAGIINGTTNYILSKMTDEKLSYAQALSEAQSLGYAEADPTADVEGFDAVYKLSILASLAFHTRIPFDVVYREGISKLTKSDIESGKELGYVLKLLAIARRDGDKIEVRCHPAFVPETHPLTGVRGAFNAVFLKGDNVGDVMLYGRGAGALPTASAVVSDIVYASKRGEPEYTTFENDGKLSDDITLIKDFGSKYYFMAEVKDVPGILGEITTILGRRAISVDSIIQRSQNEGYAHVMFLTHVTSENAMQSAIEEIRKMAATRSVESIIRVYE